MTTDGDCGGGQSPPLEEIRKTPGWAITIGVISIIYASSSILYDLILISHFPTGQPLLSTCGIMLRIGITGLLLLAGVSLLCRSPYTALLHRLWACITLLGGIVVLVMGMALGFSSTLEGVLAGIALVFLVIGYPVFLLIWFSRRKVRRQVLAWRVARSKRT